jgi:hypothetical protein
LDSYEGDEWKSVKNPKAEIKKLSKYAKNTLQKDKRIIFFDVKLLGLMDQLLRKIGIDAPISIFVGIG